MANPKLSTLADAFAGPTIDAARWGTVTAGVVTLDAVNGEVALAVPTASGATNVFGTSALYDATGSAVYAQVGVAANGAGNTATIMRVRYDASNAASMRVESSVFKLTVTTAGTLTSLTLPAYDPHQHRWWRLRESGGSFYADTSPDGLNWTVQGSLPYGFDATSVTLRFESAAGGTEIPGNVCTIAHVNTRTGGPVNPNWPTMETGWGAFWGASNAAMPSDRFVDVTDRTRGTSSVQRGRQYELDQVRSGEASVRLANTDAALDPVNASSPWAGHIAPYQPYRKRAQWPPSRNLLEAFFATGGETGLPPTQSGAQAALGPIPTFFLTDINTDTDSSGGAFVAAADAWLGDTVMQFAVPAATVLPARIAHYARIAPRPGLTYTVQMRVRNVTPSTSVVVQPHIGWYIAGTTTKPNIFVYGTTSTLTGATSAGWTTLTLTATAPANAAGMNIGVSLAAVPTADVSVQVDGVQAEVGTTATAWTCPGRWYSVYSGFTERWPSTWDLDGTYSIVEPTAVDGFSLLSQRQLDDALTMELNSYSPRFVYKFDDPAGSTSVADWTGNNPAAQIGIGKYGAGSVTFGNAITANDATNGIYTGSTGTVATVNNSNPGTNSTAGGASFISLSAAGIVGPSDLSKWTRMIAFRWTGPNTIANRAVLWSSFSRSRADGFPSGAQLWFYIDSDGCFRMAMGGPTTNWVSFRSDTPIVTDGNWHIALVSYDRTTAQVNMRVDGHYTYWINADPGLEPSGLVSDTVGAWVDPTVGNGTTYNVKGDISFVAEFPTALTVQQMFQIYIAWRNSCAGEASYARYQRILRYAGYAGTWWTEAGLTQAMGPANIDGQDAMSALQSVVDTENGIHYFDAMGVITFKGRNARYNAAAPAFTFGERADLGELPYEDCSLDFDSTHLSNEVTVTQEGTGQTFYASDDASIAAYFPRTMSRTINSQNSAECQDAASYLLSRYRQPATRVSSLKLHPSAVPALWPVCLGLELGTRVRVMRRPPGAPPVQVDCYAENLQWEFSDDGEAWLTIQCSPADLTPYGVVAAWHTTLASSVSVGATSLTVRAVPGAAGIPLASQLAAGQQLVLGQGTANAETVTVSAVGATSPGWTTATITLTAAATKAHAAGDTLCEPLPAAQADPTAWDKVAAFDAIAFSY
ncbi:hypothetical protein [Streptomyces sp. BBFR109]|uniref:hypothetical protein n=1 Tax=Streptomyces sp. BBFR109 TaxID=3448172 RepID=UPI003F7648C6